MKILDVCCGSRMFWYDKQEPHTTYMDIRKAVYTAMDRGNERGGRIMHIYEVIMLNPEYDGEDHFVVAKSEKNAKQLVVDYYEQQQDGYSSPVTMHDLAVNGPVEPEDYAEEMLLN